MFLGPGHRPRSHNVHNVTTGQGINENRPKIAGGKIPCLSSRNGDFVFVREGKHNGDWCCCCCRDQITLLVMIMDFAGSLAGSDLQVGTRRRPGSLEVD